MQSQAVYRPMSGVAELEDLIIYSNLRHKVPALSDKVFARAVRQARKNVEGAKPRDEREHRILMFAATDMCVGYAERDRIMPLRSRLLRMKWRLIRGLRSMAKSLET